jgi:hypothetical protein
MNLDESEVGVLIHTCTKSQAKQIRNLRDQGYPYKTIGYKLSMSVGRVSRFDRVYEKFGIEVFANDK